MKDPFAIEDLGRRRVLQSTLVGGAWLIGLSLPSLRAAAQTDTSGSVSPKPNPMESYLRFAEDGGLTVYTTVTNLGQGTHVLVMQTVMEELALPPELIHIKHAPVSPEFHQTFPRGVLTYASAGFTATQASVAPAAAAAREMLVAAAARLWHVEVSACRVENAAVVHSVSGRKLAYRDLYKIAANMPVPASPQIRPVKQWTVLGQSLPRPDVPARVDGSVKYGIDVAPIKLMYAAVVHAPRFGETVLTVDSRAALKRKGVKHIVKLDNAVAVVADSYWTAQQASLLLQIRWQAAPHAAQKVPDTADMQKQLMQAVRSGKGQEFPIARWQDSRAVAQHIQAASVVIETEFEAPFLAHAPMEVMNATAEVNRRGAQLWLSTQSQTDTQRAVAQALGMTLEQVQIHSQNVGGGFGRRLEKDFAVEAVLIAKEVDGPVKLIWSRENDLRAGYYRPITSACIRLALGDDGLPTAMRCDIASPSLLQYSNATNNPPVQGFDWTVTMGLLGTAYRIGKNDLRWSKLDFAVPCAYWRSVGNSQNTHFLEHSLELAASATKIESIAYRRRLLQDNPTALTFLNRFCELSNWATPLPERHFRGFAMNGLGKTLFSAHVIEIEVLSPGVFRLHKIFAGIDPGVAANPGAIQTQMIGGTIFGLSAAIYGEITLKDGKVDQGNFDQYRLLSMAQVPTIEVFVLPNGEAPQGVGEEGPPSAIAALANALLAAEGRLVNRLPVSRSGWRLQT